MRFILIMVLIFSVFLPSVHAKQSVERTTVDRPDDVEGYQVQVMYIVPADGIDRELDTSGAIATSIKSVLRWLEKQTLGQTLRLDTYQGEPDIVFVRLSQSEAVLESQGLYIRDAIEAELITMGFNHPQKLYAVYYDGKADGACGGGAWPPEIIGRVGAIYLQGRYADPAVPTCDTLSLTDDENAPGYFEFSVLHELFHSLGAVQPCAPNHHAGGHSSDNPKDLMWTGDEPWGFSALDVGNDDYYRHNNTNCYDLEDSVFMTPSVENPILPPGWGTDTAPPLNSTVASSTCAPVNYDLTTLFFWNTSARDVNIYWVGYDCTETYYTTLKAGMTYRQGTYLQHPWRVRDANTGELIVETIPVGSLPYTIPISG